MSQPPSIAAIADLFGMGQTDAPEHSELAKEGTTAQESSELGRANLGEGHYETAIRHFRKAVEQGSPEAVLDLADAYAASDQLPQAYRQYERAKRAQAGADPLVGLAEVTKRYGRYRDAVEHLEAAIRAEPTQSYHHYKLAETLAEMGERKRALAAVENAVLLKADEAPYHHFMAELLLKMGRYDEALDAFRAAIELSPGDDYLYLRSAVAFWRAEREKEALKAVRLASELDPDSDLYQAVIALLLDESGEHEEARLAEKASRKMDRYDEERLNRLMAEMGIEA